MVFEVRRQPLRLNESVQPVNAGLLVRIGAVMHHLGAAAFFQLAQPDLAQEGRIVFLGDLFPGGFHNLGCDRLGL